MHRTLEKPAWQVHTHPPLLWASLPFQFRNNIVVITSLVEYSTHHRRRSVQLPLKSPAGTWQAYEDHITHAMQNRRESTNRFWQNPKNSAIEIHWNSVTFFHFSKSIIGRSIDLDPGLSYYAFFYLHNNPHTRTSIVVLCPLLNISWAHLSAFSARQQKNTEVCAATSHHT